MVLILVLVFNLFRVRAGAGARAGSRVGVEAVVRAGFGVGWGWSWGLGWGRVCIGPRRCLPGLSESSLPSGEHPGSLEALLLKIMSPDRTFWAIL